MLTAPILLPQTPEQGLPGLRVGESWGVDLGFYDLTETDVRRLAESGLKWVRRDLVWSDVEKKKNVFDFAAYDRLLTALAKADGVRPVFTLRSANQLYGETAATADFVRFLKAALATYKGRGIVWEIGNDPSRADYAAFASEVADVFARAAPGETFVGPGLAGFDLGSLETLAKSGLLKKLKGLTVSPARTGEPEGVMADVARLRTLNARYGVPGLPILSGSWGYPTVPGGLSPETQADYAARQGLVLLAAGVPMSIWHEWRNPVPDARPEAPDTGLLRPDGTPNPAFESIRSITDTLGGFRYRMRLAAEKPEDWVLLFDRDGRPGIAAWTVGAPHEVEVYPGVKMNLTPRPQTLVPERRSAFLDGALALPSIPPFVAYEGPEEAARLLRSVQASLPPGGRMEARLLLPVIGPKRIQLGQGELGSDEALTKYLSSLPRAPEPIRLRLIIPLAGGELRQETLLQSTRPISAEVRPKADGTGVLAITATGGFEGTLKILRGEKSEEKPLKLADGEEATFDLPSLDMPAIAVFTENGRVVRVTESSRFVPVSLAGLSVVADGPEGVYGRATVADPAPEAGYPDAKEIAFQLGKGKKTLLARLSEPKFIPGRPTAYGLWVLGDGTGALVSMRFEDATGQTFQPAPVAIDWKGWRYVRLSLRGDTGTHSGGANDGVVHLPVKITTPLVIDSAGNTGVQGTMRVAGVSVSSETE